MIDRGNSIYIKLNIEKILDFGLKRICKKKDGA